MKKLILLRGVSGCGKTTLINNLNLQDITININYLRNLFYGEDFFNTNIYNKDNYSKEIFNLLSKRMECGLLTIVNSNHILTRHIEKYQMLCKKYNYECIVVDFNTSLPILLKNNNVFSKTDIEKMFKDKNNQKIPFFCKKIKPEFLEKEIQEKYIDLSKYKKIIHIGDIHGCATILKESILNLSFNNFYIFCGDYIDRGIENIETLKFLIELKNRPNIVFLKGNHELNLIKYIDNLELSNENLMQQTYSKSFERTKNEIEESDISLKDLKLFSKNLNSYFLYSYNGKKVICTHGGISNDKNLNIMSEFNFIIGYGEIEIDIDLEWDNYIKNKEIQYQIHGHRNFTNRPISMPGSYSFNLEGSVENGGDLRILELSDKGFLGRTYKNNLYNK